MEDPKVFKAFTNPKSRFELWKKTCGFDFVTFLEGPGGKANVSQCPVPINSKSAFVPFRRKCWFLTVTETNIDLKSFFEKNHV